MQPSPLPSGVASGIKEVKGEVKGDVEPKAEVEAEAESGQPAAAAVGGPGGYAFTQTRECMKRIYNKTFHR
jgi:hypothetical protein